MKIRIRTKLAAALAVPLVALVVVAGLQARQASAESDRIEQEAELAFVALGPGSVTAALQDERNFASLDLIGLSDAADVGVTSYADARAATEAGVDGLRASLDGLDPEVRGAFEPAFASLDDLDEVRAAYEGYDGDKELANQKLAQQVFGAYTRMIDAFFDATSTVATQVDEAALRNGVEIVDAANRRNETMAIATRNVVVDTLAGGGSLELRVEAIGLVERLETLNARIEQLAVGPYGEVATETFARPATERTLEIFHDYARGGDVEITELLATVGTEEGAASITEAATGVLAAQAGELAGDARDDVRLFTILAAIVVSLAIVVTYVAATSITRPLRRLRAEAEEMAGRRLPEALRTILDTPPGDDVVLPELAPIEVQTRDEVREVVAALNEVQERTLSLAVDQAVLRRNFADSFVNLGRRNQNLLDRQLEFITELEQMETEPEQLDALFRLDHLATRMRRNAESLLVLAGTESPRQWGAPVELDAVLRAGLGEVEDYRRVRIRHLDDVAVAGGAAAAVSHVVAELTENALQFSPPDEEVEIKGRRGPDGYVVAIADNGIGMTADDLERANRRLSGSESYTVAPSRYLGHYVAGQLAGPLGVAVRLQDNPAGGIVATVVLPTNLLEEPTEPTLDPPTDEPAAPGAEPFPPAAAPGGDDATPVDAAPAADRPATLADALGSGRLDAVRTVEDLERAIDGDAVEPPSNDSPPHGLPRRVPGAQRPDANPLTARVRRDEPGALPRRNPPAERTNPDATPAPFAQQAPDARPTAHDVASAGLFGFLADFNDGAARARTDHDAAGPRAGADPEEER